MWASKFRFFVSFWRINTLQEKTANGLSLAFITSSIFFAQNFKVNFSRRGFPKYFLHYIFLYSLQIMLNLVKIPDFFSLVITTMTSNRFHNLHQKSQRHFSCTTSDWIIWLICLLLVSINRWFSDILELLMRMKIAPV